VLVHGAKSCEYLLEGRLADRDHQREADRGVIGVATAHPVPEHEHVGAVDAELSHRLGVGGHRDEVLGHRVLASVKLVQQPVSRGGGVGEGLGGGERLRAHHEQRLGRVQVVSVLPQVDGVDVGDKPAGDVGRRVVLERLVGHRRAEVRAADADVHHVADPPAGVPGPAPIPDVVRQLAHLIQDSLHL